MLCMYTSNIFVYCAVSVISEESRPLLFSERERERERARERNCQSLYARHLYGPTDQQPIFGDGEFLCERDITN
jgi:hypothetical protein